MIKVYISIIVVILVPILLSYLSIKEDQERSIYSNYIKNLYEQQSLMAQQIINLNESISQLSSNQSLLSANFVSYTNSHSYNKSQYFQFEPFINPQFLYTNFVPYVITPCIR